MKRIAMLVAGLCLSQMAWAQSPPPPQSSSQSVGKPHVCLQDYPFEAIVAGEQGTTIIAYRITTAGTLIEIHVLQSSGSTRLDDAAVACAASWRYKPAMQDGKPVEVPWKAEVRWVLNQPPPDPAAEKAFRACAATYAGLPPHLAQPDATTVVVVLLSQDVPTDAGIRLSSGDAALDAHALACAKKDWAGEPGHSYQVLSVRWRDVLKPG